MSEALQYTLNFDAAPAVSSSQRAAEQIKANFNNSYESIKATYSKPLQMQLDVRSDAQKKLDAMYDSTNKIKRASEEINKKYKLAQKLQDKVTNAVKGTKAEKEKALKLVKRLQRNTKLTSKEMQVLRGHARKLVDELVKTENIKIGKGTENLGQSFFNASLKATLAYRAIQLVADAIKNTITTGMQMETLGLQLEAFTGSAQAAEQAMQRFADIASRSPLDVLQIADAGKTMMAFGLSTDEAKDSVEQLATVSAATGADLNNMARNIGQIQAQGRAYTRDLTQFAMQGVPIWEELSKVTGRSVAELKKMATEGDIGFQSVSAALREMTRQGTAFSEIAERMQETYAGRLALLESNFQIAAGNIIKEISRIDEQLGLSEKVLKLLGLAAKSLANDFGSTSTALEDSNYQANIMRDSVANVTEKLAQADKATQTWAQRVLGIDLNPFKSAAGTVEQVRRETDGARIAANNMGMSVNELTERLRYMLVNGDPKGLVPKFQSVAQEIGLTSQQLEEQQREYLKLQGITDSVIAKALEANQRKKEAVKDALQEEMLAYEDMAQKVKDSYAQVKESVDASIEGSNQRIASLQKEIDKTRELGPAGKKLAQIRRRELEYTARTGEELEDHITAEQRKALEAQATLERLDGQEEAERLAKEQARERENIAKQQNILKKEENRMSQELLDIQEKQKDAQEKFGTELEELNDTISALTAALGGELLNNFDLVVEEAAKVAPETANAKTATLELNTAIKGTKTELGLVLKRLDAIATKIRKMPRLPMVQSNFAGGPISAGERSIVNELGKEAFLSASGKLSMINAPAWGEWTAPSSGTIIPAHLTKQLDIPTGGINLNRNAGAVAMRKGGPEAVVAAVKAGDNIVNNVTIQSSNTRQQAMDTMVQLARLKRARYS